MMIRKNLFSSLTVAMASATLLFFSACHKDKKPTPGEIAAQTAKSYYDELIAGHDDAFIKNTYFPYKIPDSYRDQLVTNIKMFMGQQKEEHQGIKKVDIISAKADTIRKTADVFLRLHYGDGTKEEIAVPMVLVKKRWMMK